jgi:twitching motility two-component system response regulator PilG
VTVSHASEEDALLAGLRLLVVDDSRTVRRSAAYCLESAGAIVELANDGFDALAQIVDKRPDAVVADVVMPRLDGYHLCALVRHNADFMDLPILLLSSRDGLFDRARASLVGATDYLAKPFTNETLVSAVADIVDRRSVEAESQSD